MRTPASLGVGLAVVRDKETGFIHVSRIQKGSPADQCSEINVGDMLEAVHLPPGRMVQVRSIHGISDRIFVEYSRPLMRADGPWSIVRA